MNTTTTSNSIIIRDSMQIIPTSKWKLGSLSPKQDSQMLISMTFSTSQITSRICKRENFRKICTPIIRLSRLVAELLRGNSFSLLKQQQPLSIIQVSIETMCSTPIMTQLTVKVRIKFITNRIKSEDREICTITMQTKKFHNMTTTHITKTHLTDFYYLF